MISLGSDDPAPLHVLEVVGNAIVGGMERHVQMLAEGLLRQGFAVSALCPFESHFTSALRASGCEVHIAMMEEAMPWASLLAATEIIHRRRIDLVHTHMFNATFLGSLAGSLVGVPVVTTAHGMQILPQELALVRLTNSHLITVCTAARMMALSLGLPEEQVSLIPNGVDVRRFHPEVDGRPFRRRLQVPDGTPLVGMVARLSREKGPDLFVQAASLVAAVRPDVHFALVGEGPLQRELMFQVDGLGLHERFHFVGLAADTRPIYPALDVACLPSRMEGQPLTVLEAMAAGRPVVATNVGGIPEVVEMGETGWLVAQGDMKALSEQILWLLDNPERAAQMGQAGRQRALEHFDVDRQTQAVGRLFQRLVANRRPQQVTALHLGKVYNRARVS